jgi:hypothetical protein
MIQPYDVAIPWQTNLTYFLIIQSFRFICRKKENGSFSFKRKRKMRRAKHPTKSIYIVQKKWIPYILPPLYFGKTYVSKKKRYLQFFFRLFLPTRKWFVVRCVTNKFLNTQSSISFSSPFLYWCKMKANKNIHKIRAEHSHLHACI